MVFDETIRLLTRNGVQVSVLERSSKQFSSGLSGKLAALGAGIYSPSAIMAMTKIIQEKQPDLVHVHELYPLLPWVLKACGKMNVPVVMTCHNYRLFCPTHLCFSQDRICKRCQGGREYWCIFKNCRANLFESTAFALHNVVARKTGIFSRNVTLFIAPSQFLKECLIEASFEEERIRVLPHMVAIPSYEYDPSGGKYVAYVGRVSSEKGIKTLLEAAANLPDVPINITGDRSLIPQLVKVVPKSVKFLGWMDRTQLSKFFQKARLIVVPSTSFETFGLAAAEAMGHGLPVIASRRGALEEIVEDGITGLFFEPENAEDLSSKIKFLWQNPDLCKQFGIAGRHKVMQIYHENRYYCELMAIYKEAIVMRKSTLW